MYSLTYWYGIRKEFVNRERLLEAKEAGFTVVTCEYDRETNLRVLADCAELGLKANVSDERITNALDGHEDWEQEVAAAAADYRDCPALNRYFVRDEPLDPLFPALKRVSDALRQYDPAHGSYINFLPLDAVPAEEEGQDLIDRYRIHMDRFIEALQPSILSFDRYNLAFREVDSLEGRIEAPVSEENRIRNHWEGKLYEKVDDPRYYTNLELIREEAMRHGLPWTEVILLVEHMRYRLPSEAEIRWEAFTAAAYGATQISYFTYWTPGIGHDEPWSYHNGIILSDGTRGEKYALVQRINAELHRLHEALLPAPGEPAAPAEGGSEPTAAHEAVYHVGEETDPLTHPFRGHGFLDRVDARTAIVGCYGGGRFLIVNKDHEAAETVTLYPKDGHTAEHFDKQKAAWTPCSAYTLAPGDGELFRIR